MNNFIKVYEINEKTFKKELGTNNLLLLHNLISYYKNVNIDFLRKIAAMINGSDNKKSKSKISLRVMEHFVTKYAINNKLIYIAMIDGIEQPFDVKISYKAYLDTYKKRNFDPFRRNYRFTFQYDENETFITTIGQLNFFKWVYKHGVLEYIEDNLEKIKDDMTKSEEKTCVTKKIKNINIHAKHIEYIDQDKVILQFSE